MITVRVLVFNPFSENTYIASDDTGECIIIDPGCENNGEREELQSVLKKNGLKPVKIINTHCHIDHILGNAFVKDTFSRERFLALKPAVRWDLILLSKKGILSSLGHQSLIVCIYPDTHQEALHLSAVRKKLHLQVIPCFREVSEDLIFREVIITCWLNASGKNCLPWIRPLLYIPATGLKQQLQKNAGPIHFLFESIIQHI
jgi:hypothetical protein